SQATAVPAFSTRPSLAARASTHPSAPRVFDRTRFVMSTTGSHRPRPAAPPSTRLIRPTHEAVQPTPTARALSCTVLYHSQLYKFLTFSYIFSEHLLGYRKSARKYWW